MEFKKFRIDEITTNLDSMRKPLNNLERAKISKYKLYPYYGANNLMDYVDEYIFDEEILCVAEDGGTWGLNEKCSYIVNEKCWVNNHAHVLRASENLNLKYLYYYLNHNDLNKYITGTTRGKLTKSALNKIEILLPEKINQNKIVEVLDKAKELIDKRKEQLEALDELVKSRFIEIFDNKNYKKQELGSLILENSTLSYGIVVPGDNVEHGIKMIRPLNFVNGKIELENLYKVDSKIESKYAKTRLFGDEILIQVIGEPGKVVLTTPECRGMNITRNLAVIRQNNEVINKYYLKEYLSSNEAQKFINKGINKSTLKQLPLGTLRKLDVKIPPIELQNEFADFVKQVDKLKSQIETSLKELEDNFNSLMQKAFKGELF